MKVAEILRRAAQRLAEDAAHFEEIAEDATGQGRNQEAADALDHAGENRESADDLVALADDFERTGAGRPAPIPEFQTTTYLDVERTLVEACALLRRLYAVDGVAATSSALDQIRADFVAAAGEFPVSIPEPGSTIAKLLSANVLMRRELEKARQVAEQSVAAFASLVYRAEEMVGDDVRLETEHKIAAFLEMLAERASRYHVAPHAPGALRTAAADVRDGRWRSS